MMAPNLAALVLAAPVLAALVASPALAQSNPGPQNTDPGPRAAPAMVDVGPGNTDPSPRQLVRTRHDVLYVIAPNGTIYAPTAPTTTRLIVWQANKSGTPTRLHSDDAAHAPGGGVNTSASAIDGADRIHSVWITPGRATYGIFDTATGRWQTPVLLEQTGWSDYGQGDEGAGIAVNAAGLPYAVWNYRDGTGALRLHLGVGQPGGGFAAPVIVDDVDVNGGARHPAVAFAPNGDLVVSWIDGDGGYSTAGLVRTRVLHADGVWDASYVVPGETAGSSLDQSCSLLIGADGTRHITFLDDTNRVRYYYDTGAGWQGDEQPADQITHDPVLGPDGAGGLYIYGHATPVPDYRGLGDGKFRFHKPAGATAWSPYTLIRDGYIDDATSARWSQFFDNFPQEVDFTWWNHNPMHTIQGAVAGYYIEVGVQTADKPVLAGAIDLQMNPDGNPAGSAEAFQTTAAQAGTIGRLGWFIDTPNTAAHIALGIYADASGQPGARLGSCTLSGVATGGGQWHECPLGAAGVPVSAGTPYWLAILGPAGGGTASFRDVASGGTTVASVQTDLSALPAVWASGSVFANSPAAAYGRGK